MPFGPALVGSSCVILFCASLPFPIPCYISLCQGTNCDDRSPVQTQSGWRAAAWPPSPAFRTFTTQFRGCVCPTCFLQLETTGGVFADVLTCFGGLEEPTATHPGGGGGGSCGSEAQAEASILPKLLGAGGGWVRWANDFRASSSHFGVCFLFLFSSACLSVASPFSVRTFRGRQPLPSAVPSPKEKGRLRGTNLGLRSDTSLTLCVSLVMLLASLHFGFLSRNRAENPSSWDTAEYEMRQPVDCSAPFLAQVHTQKLMPSLSLPKCPGSSISSLNVPPSAQERCSSQLSVRRHEGRQGVLTVTFH